MKDFCRYVLPAILVGGVLMSACSDNKRYLDSALGGAYERYSLVMQDAAAEGAEEIPELSVFQFSDGAFYLKQQVKPDASGAVSISATSGSTLYFVSGVSLPLSGESVNEEEFRRIAVGRNLHDNSAPEFLTAVVDLGGGEAVDTRAGSDGRTLVELKRSVARIDLGKPADEQIRIREIVIEDAPAAIYPFLEGMPVSEETVSYRKVFETGVGDKQEALFRIFESPRPVHLQVLGSYGDVPLRLNMELPTVECNKVYELEVRNAGSTVEGTIQIKPWDEGGTVVGSPDAGNRILIDADRSRIPAGVKVDYANNLVEVPAEGTREMTLAFAGDTRIDIASVEGAGTEVELSDVVVEEESLARIVSSFDVSVAAQGKGRLGYSVMVHLKNATMAESYDYVEIRVAPSKNQIETVEMGGSTWMAFNARSRNLDDQVYPLDGITVEEMYQESWINTVGGLFQFGRLYMYVPWQSYNPSNNLGNQTAEAPWVSDTHMPCPEGYRVPTRNEWRALLPNDAQIPGTYTAANGEQITASLHVANGKLVTPTGVTGTQRYVKLVSDATGNTLIFPMAGYKGDKSTSNNPDFGNWALMWTNDRTGCPGGYAWMRRLRFNSAANSISVIDEYQWQMEGFGYVRCVKK